jgi:diamine N-acetyltransferase
VHAGQVCLLEAYEREACRYSQRAIHEAGISGLDQWLADCSACDLAFLRHLYTTGERRAFREFWIPGQPLIEPLAIPPFTPTRWRRREQAIVLGGPQNLMNPPLVPPADVTLTPVTEPDFPVLRQLADTICRQHYVGIITVGQIDYMLAGRCSDEALREHVQAADKWLKLLRVSGTPVGYCGYELASMDRDSDAPSRAAMKLGQLYVLESHRGRGLGRFMLGHVAGRARELDRRALWLQVNKRNMEAVGFYRSAGFEVVREAVFEIGGGFVMDDYVMAKRVESLS